MIHKQEFLTEKRASGICPGTIEIYLNAFSNFERFCKIPRPDRSMIVRWSEQIEKDGLAPLTRKRMISCLHTYFAWMKTCAYLKENPVPSSLYCRIVGSPVIPVIINEAEYRLLLGVAEGEWIALIRLGWETGMRLGDCATVRHDEVDVERGFIRKIPQKTKRFGKVVEVPISRVLTDLLTARSATSPYCLPGLAKTYTKRGHLPLVEGMRTLCRRARLSGKSFHKFRHGFVTRHITNGVNPALIASCTGQSLDMLMRYASAISVEAKRNALFGADDYEQARPRQTLPAPGQLDLQVRPGEARREGGIGTGGSQDPDGPEAVLAGG